MTTPPPEVPQTVWDGIVYLVGILTGWLFRKIIKRK